MTVSMTTKQRTGTGTATTTTTTASKPYQVEMTTVAIARDILDYWRQIGAKDESFNSIAWRLTETYKRAGSRRVLPEE